MPLALRLPCKPLDTFPSTGKGGEQDLLMELEERVITVRVQQEDSFMMANLIIHSSSRASVTGPQEAGRRRSETNSLQGSHPEDTHTRNGRPCTTPQSSTHQPAQELCCFNSSFLATEDKLRPDDRISAQQSLSSHDRYGCPSS